MTDYVDYGPPVAIAPSNKELVGNHVIGFTPLHWNEQLKIGADPEGQLWRTTAYNIVGTIDNSYKPPNWGQLWPRGDLDAT